MLRWIVIVLLIIIAIMYYRSVKRENTRNRDTADGCDPREEFDPYQVLQISRDATPEEIHKAWVSLAAQYHPDKAAHLGEDLRKLAEKRFKEIQRAYDILKKD